MDKNEAQQIIDTDGTVLGTVKNRTSQSDFGMVSAPRFHREELKRHLLVGQDYQSQFLTEQVREEVISEVLEIDPERIANSKFCDDIERAKKKMSRVITDKVQEKVALRGGAEK